MAPIPATTLRYLSRTYTSKDFVSFNNLCIIAVRSDFNVVPINDHLGDRASDLNTNFPFLGHNGSVKSFPIEGDPVDDAYLLINHTDVHNSGHRILINGSDLPGVDMPDADGKWSTQMVLLPPGRLRRGINSVQVIHWREND